ncbi:MAG: hypothetical protein GC166_04305 [Alphaproteobacteria bacterium]|nr:hypothetical protein [Alphaproteobacteria bacterium]
MAQEVHFEIFKRHGSKGGWILHDVTSSRDAAIKTAQELMGEGGATGVKVVKETYNADTGDFLTLKIFEDGHSKMKSEAAAEDVPHALPCFKPDDLYSYHARATIARLLGEYLARQKLTVIELIHRADALEKFEATGTVYQHAIQKIAVAQASSTTTPVQQIVKSLNELVTKSIHRVYRDAKRDYFPKTVAGKFSALAQKMAADSDGLYRLNGSLAVYLRDAKGWDEKLTRLLGTLSEAQTLDDGPAKDLLLSAVDAIISELLSGSAALHELIGQSENLSEALSRLVSLFLGQPVDGASDGVGALTKQFANDALPDSRIALANRILAELKSVKRLCPNSLTDELKSLRRIANRLVMGIGKYMRHEDLIAAFTLRSKRIVTHENIGAHLAEAAQPDEKLERLLFVEENIIGVENKRHLASFVMPVITATAFESFFLASKLPSLERLSRLGELQTRVRRAGFQDKEKADISDLLDRLASEIETRSKLFESIESRPVSHVEKAIALLRLSTSGALTEGRVSHRARALILSHLGKPGFLSGYAQHMAKFRPDQKADSQAAMTELVQTLEKAGITQETGLKNIAA